MKITDIFKSFGQLNEAPVKTNASKGKDTRAEAGKRDPRYKEKLSQREGGEVKQLAKDGKGIGQEGGQAIRKANQERRSGEFDARVEKNKEDQKRKGTLSPNNAYGSNTSSEAAKSAAKHDADMGEFDRDRKDKTKDTRQRFSNDMRRNDAGLDAAQQARNAAPRDEEEEEAPKSAKDIEYSDRDIEKYGDAMGGEIGRAMRDQTKRVRKEKEQAKKGPAVSDAGAAAQKAHAAQKKAERDALGDLSDEAQERADQKAKVASLNKDARDSLSDEEKEIGMATGGRRTELEVTDTKRKAHEEGIMNLTDEEVSDLALEAQHGDKDAVVKLWKRYVGLLRKEAGKYSFGDGEKLSDLYGEGKAAMMQAIQNYDPNSGATFSTWIMRNVAGLVKNAAYADRNIKMDPRKMQRVQQMNKIKQQLEHEGFQGMDLSLEIIERMGLGSWDEYEQLKKDAAAMSTKSMSDPTQSEDGQEGEFGDSLGGEGIESEYHGDADNNVEQSGLEKEIATQDSETVKERIHQLYDEAGISDDHVAVIDALFGVGGQEPMSPDEIQAAFGINRYGQQKLIANAFDEMANILAMDNGTSHEEEKANLAKILKNARSDYKSANAGRSYMDGREDEEDERTPEQKAEDEQLARERKNIADAKRKKQGEADAKKKAASKPGLEKAKADHAKAQENPFRNSPRLKESLSESMRNWLDDLDV